MKKLLHILFLVLIAIIVSLGIWMVFQLNFNTIVTTTGSLGNYPPPAVALAPQSVLPQKFTLTGDAHASWFFDGSMPVRIVGPVGIVLWKGLAQAHGNTTEDAVVLFTVDVDLDVPWWGPATIIIMRDNETEDPAYDASFSIPIIIMPGSQNTAPVQEVEPN